MAQQRTSPTQSRAAIPTTSPMRTVIIGPAVEELDETGQFHLGIDPSGDALGDYADLDQDGDVKMESSEDEGGLGNLEESDWETETEEDVVTKEPLRAIRTAGAVTDRDPAPNLQRHRLQRDEAKRQLLRTLHVVQYPGGAGKPIGTLKTCNNVYATQVPTTQNIYAPFSSRINWEIARWAKLRGPGSTALTELLRIPEVPDLLGLSFCTTDELNDIVDKRLPGRPRFARHKVLIGDEVCKIFYRDIIECIRSLFGDPDFGAYLVFVPEKHYTDAGKTKRMFHDGQTGRWWWAMQEEVERDSPGATIIPIIISTDKTQLTLFCNKTAYPIYLTIGNIPKEIRRRPSSRAYVLLSYLPTTTLELVANKAARRRMLTNLYHACMKKVLEPLEKAGVSILTMVSGNGATYKTHPIFACFVGDYTEEILALLGTTGKCACCPIPHDWLGDHVPEMASKLRDLSAILNILDSFKDHPEKFLKSCAEGNVKLVIEPFWINSPYTHIFRSITPDVLHQLYQGIVKHLVAWLIEAFGAAKIDARCRRMPPNHQIRIFGNGISSLLKVTGHEHDQICRILLGLVLDMPPLDGTVLPAPVVRCVRAILDFLYLAQYPVHTDNTLSLLDDALARFHADKDVFVKLGIRENFNLPKLHFALHYTQSIRLFGTTDNFNTEYTERLHIDFTKDAYRATKKKDKFTQMTVWLERHEKIYRHDQFVNWRVRQHEKPQKPILQTWSPPGLDLDRRLHLAKCSAALARFVTLTNEPNITRGQLEHAIWNFHLPLRKLSVWHHLKFQRMDVVTGKPPSTQFMPGRLGWIRDGNLCQAALTRCSLTTDLAGLQALQVGYCVGRVRAIFSLPIAAQDALFKSSTDITQHLAYIEWYTKLQTQPDLNHRMYNILPLIDKRGDHISSIIPVTDIRQSIHLFPKFGSTAFAAWTSATVLNNCRTFYINPFSNKFLYRTMY
ncbi:hypothetical protein BC835DRAFT_1454729 [Cytidiella melzeri]|nr:hypothetical protein BC835DRAFT_1454729 [Cytidiella melzeri]